MSKPEDDTYQLLLAQLDGFPKERVYTCLEDLMAYYTKNNVPFLVAVSSLLNMLCAFAQARPEARDIIAEATRHAIQRIEQSLN